MVPRSCRRPLPEDTANSKPAEEAPPQHLCIPQRAIRRTFQKGESRCSQAVSQQTQGRRPRAGSMLAVPPGGADCAGLCTLPWTQATLRPEPPWPTHIKGTTVPRAAGAAFPVGRGR